MLLNSSVKKGNFSKKPLNSYFNYAAMKSTFLFLMICALCWSCSTNSERYMGNQLVTGDGIASLENVDNTMTWSTYLRRLPGLIVKGEGENLSVRVRVTNNSFLMDSSPLFVLDNMALGNDFSSLAGAINLADVQSITVLKNANETAVWGLRGANGVVVVRSKKPGY